MEEPKEPLESSNLQWNYMKVDHDGRYICGGCSTALSNNLTRAVLAGHSRQCPECLQHISAVFPISGSNYENGSLSEQESDASKGYLNSVQNCEAYQEQAARTECNYHKARRRLGCGVSAGVRIDRVYGTRLVHGVLGLMGELGEVAASLERWVYYGQDLDEVNLKEEIGDVLWYVALLCNTLQYPMQEAMEQNIAKLRVRYPEKFEEGRAAENGRDRDSEREVFE